MQIHVHIIGSCRFKTFEFKVILLVRYLSVAYNTVNRDVNKLFICFSIEIRPATNSPSYTQVIEKIQPISGKLCTQRHLLCFVALIIIIIILKSTYVAQNSQRLMIGALLNPNFKLVEIEFCCTIRRLAERDKFYSQF